MSAGNPKFLSMGNLRNIILSNFEIGLVCVTMTFVILTAGMDMSVGSIAGLANMLVGYFAVTLGWSLPLAILAALAVGALVGVLNGFLVITMENSNPMIITIGTMVLVRAVCTFLTKGWTISGFPAAFRALSYGRLAGINITIILLFVLMLAGQWILSRTTIGTYTYAIGNNEKSTFFSGIKVRKMKFFLYIASALMASTAGIFLASRMQTSFPDAGDGYHMDAIAAIVIGGTSISGGEGNMIGTLLGFFIIAALKNGLSLMGVPALTQMIYIGLVLILTILINNLIKKRRERKSLMEQNR
jgi:ribose/xylose/arabinose/galactoside ABC-type transport system permease subunit